MWPVLVVEDGELAQKIVEMGRTKYCEVVEALMLDDFHECLRERNAVSFGPRNPVTSYREMA